MMSNNKNKTCIEVDSKRLKKCCIDWISRAKQEQQRNFDALVAENMNQNILGLKYTISREKAIKNIHKRSPMCYNSQYTIFLMQDIYSEYYHRINTIKNMCDCSDSIYVDVMTFDILSIYEPSVKFIKLLYD